MKYRWSLAAPLPVVASGANISPLLAQCLFNRGITEPEKMSLFLQPRLKDLADPFLLPNMAAAVDRLLQARARGEALVIFGDYDVDGVTSTALLHEVLTKLGWKVHYYLPHRMEEGYGLSRDGVENCLKKFPVKLLLAVDCGSTSVEVIASMREQGVDVIVLDHHQVSNPPPAAVALVNPQLGVQPSGCPDSPPAEQPEGWTANFRELWSAGLAFKLAHALLKRMRDNGEAAAQELDLREYLDLVALGTIADLVPLTGENRILATIGLKCLENTQRPGLIALKEVAQCKPPIGVYEVGFQLGPRLNAAGRLEDAELSLRLILTRDTREAAKIALALDERNRERQDIERTIAAEAIASVRGEFQPERDFVIVAGKPEWHIGVVGIVASRVLHEFYRPTIVLGGDGEHWRGSGRSIEGFDLAAALRHCGDLFVRHGGHAMAAGITIHPDKVSEFRTRFNDFARTVLKPEMLQPRLDLDASVTASDLTLATVDALEKLQPSGQGNPPVRLLVRNLTHARMPQKMGKENQHVKLRVTDGRETLEAVWWNCRDAVMPGDNFDLAVTPQINEYNGKRTVQLKVLDWRAS